MSKNRKTNNRKNPGDAIERLSSSSETQIGSDTALSLTASSSSNGRDVSPSQRTFNGNSDLQRTSSGDALVNQLMVQAAAGKRDSVISSTWEGQKQSLSSILDPVRPYTSPLRPRQWWPCRSYRWIKNLLFALARACAGPRWYDLLLTMCLAAATMFGGYVAFELGLSMIKFGLAQDTAVDTGCSVVYVTIPGPIITVSLVNTSPANPARGTYYFSVVNGTTGWMDSIAPPSQFSTLATKTPGITPVISSLSPTTSPANIPNSVSGPSTIPQYDTLTSIILSSPSTPSGPTSLLFTQPSVTVPTSSIHPVSSSTITITSTPPSGRTTTFSMVTATTLETVSPGSITNAPSQITYTSLTIVMSTIPNGQTLTSTVTSTTVIGAAPTTSSIVIAPPTTLSSFATFTSTIPGGLTTIITSTSIVITTPSPIGSSPNSSPLPTSPAVVTSMSTLPRESLTSLASTTSINFSPSASMPSPSPISPMTSSILTTTTSTLPGGQTTTITLTRTTTIGTGPDAGTPPLPSMSTPSSKLNLPSTSSTQGSSSIASLSSTSLGPSSMASVITSTVTQVTGDLTTTMTQTSTVYVPITASSSPATVSSLSGSLGISTFSSRSLNLTSTSTSALSTSHSTSLSTSTKTGGIPGASSPSMFSTMVPPTNTTWFSSSRLSTSSSLLPLSSVTSSAATSSSSGVPASTYPILTSSSDATWNTVPASSVEGSMTIQTQNTVRRSSVSSLNTLPLAPTPTGAGSTSWTGPRGMSTRVISYGDMAISFVFPTPDITTTVSYWTGVYPTVSGPLPSDLQTVVLTTRSTTQTPISGLPSFSILSSRTRGFTTVVTTIYDDDSPDKRKVKREAAPQALQSLLPTTVQVGAPTSAGTSASELPGPTLCGESGNFTLNFDDTTVSSTGEQVVQVQGLKNPYHHMFYANGYANVPDKWEPYPAVSQPNVAMFFPLAGRLQSNQPFSGSLLPGELGAGPRASVDAYWFNGHSGYFGCALSGITPCVLRISGFRYDATLKSEVLVAEQNATLPACPLYMGCRLTQVFFNEQFRALSGIQFNAFTAGLGVPQIHMLDDLQLEWYNNTCSAGILRIGHV